MGSFLSCCGMAPSVLGNIFAYMIYGWSDKAYIGDSDKTKKFIPLPTFLTDDKDNDNGNASKSKARSAIKAAFHSANVDISKLSDEALVKICRQLEFWYQEIKGDEGEEKIEEEIKDLATCLINQSTWYQDLISAPSSSSDSDSRKNLKVPTTRFGKTEIQIPILTCGGMRIQNTWLPDFIPVLKPNRKTVLNSIPQQNLKQCIRTCLRLGINHFETARFYGTSEYQMVEALYELIQEGECKREDFILQTKIPAGDEKTFMKFWTQSWDNVEDKLGYIDLLSLHALADVDEKLDVSLRLAEGFKREGKVRHIGFSTHGTSEQIMACINTERFEYINLHEHYFGSYHGTGTPDTKGGHGNLACVKRAQELDMGIFQISPIDKGGKLYRPSSDVATLIGKEKVTVEESGLTLTPISFALLHAWKNIGIHTSTIGIARPSDLDEVMAAARLMALEKEGKADVTKVLEDARKRLEARALEVQGEEWVEKGLLNIPGPYDECTDGIHIGHILWIHNLLTTYGMYEFCKDRYDSLEGIKWDKKKTWEEKSKSIDRANPGRSYDSKVDLTKALENHYNPSLALQKIKETHEWLKSDVTMTDEEIEQKGWKKGYNLTVWTEMPGEIDSRGVPKVMLQTATGGRMGLVGMGPGASFRAEANQLRSALA